MMNESQHTPGPWETIDGLLRYMPFSIRAPAEKRGQFLSIAHVDGVDGFAGSSEANARLIAAAPDLLEACKSLVSMIEFTGHFRGAKGQEELARIGVIIARAEGSCEP